MVVGKTSRYLQNATESSGRFHSQQLHIVDLDATDSPPKPTNIRPTLVTGFSANHLSSGLLLLRSIAKAAATNLSVVVWAMEEFRGQDREHFHCIMKVRISPPEQSSHFHFHSSHIPSLSGDERDLGTRTWNCEHSNSGSTQSGCGSSERGQLSTKLEMGSTHGRW